MYEWVKADLYCEDLWVVERQEEHLEKVLLPCILICFSLTVFSTSAYNVQLGENSSQLRDGGVNMAIHI